MNNSAQLFARSKLVTPGGVHSPVRSLQSVNEHPLFIDSAFGSQIIDVDGNSFTDYCMAFGPLILGHSDPDVHRAASMALDNGWSYGAAEGSSLKLAELICGSIPWVESLRFVSSGTEAVMSALRLARAATGRDKVLKFSGCYHGHTDAMLIDSGSGLAETATAGSAGVTDGVAKDTLVAPLNDADTLCRIFTEHGDQIAAVIIEPLPANYGLLPQTDEFLQLIRRLCSTHSSVLIFDEVITGFRFGFRGYADTCNIKPDLVTYGKVIGGGFPVGAFGGKRELMELTAPVGPMYQAGTMSANPIAMQAGLTTLEILLNSDIYRELEEKGAYLSQQIDNLVVHVQQKGSLFWLCTSPVSSTIRSINNIPADIKPNYGSLFQHCLNDGIYLPPSAYEVGFLSTAHEKAELDTLANSINRFSL
ncbi:MAG: glutamate-1-semialdehyde 2,1-aminomutase [Gammaproteobacteria bacterium]|nr:glutamate-1-semialdehyde 2,1-aminomutase [Gammaproteobacteria bacterium]